ncbi:MAG TPA: cobalamin-binding protein [Candidatus Binatia bacterium]|nr:cobalamin-binding protein [Candidatus Binatia bacterium]
MRIGSLLPGATEIAFLLGLERHIVGVTHECDYPPQAKHKPVVVRSRIDFKRMTGREIDAKVAEILQAGKGLYTIDREAFVLAAPDIILTQGLCEVCALDYDEVVKAAALLPRPPKIISLNPRSLSDVLDDVTRVGAATGRDALAASIVKSLSGRIERIAHREPDYRPRVVCLEWLEPLYVAGHWVPEMVTLAGGHDVLGRIGEPSFKVEWSAVRQAKPDLLLLMPCGFDVRRTLKESTPLRNLDGWQELPAVKAGRVYAFNGSAYFSRPGPRLVNGLEILAHIIHPYRAGSSPSPTDAAQIH